MSKKSLDDLLKEKLANQEFVFRDEYWADASAFIQSQQPLWKKLAFWRNAAFITTAILGVGLASYFLLNKEANQPIATFSPSDASETIEVNTTLISANTTSEKIEEASTIKTETNPTENSLPKKAINYPTSTKKELIETINHKSEATKNQRITKTTQNISLPNNEAFTAMASSKPAVDIEAVQNVESSNSDVNNTLEIIETADATSNSASEVEISEVNATDFFINKLDLIEALPTAKRDTDYVSNRSKTYSKSKWYLPATASLEVYNQLKTYDFLSDSASVAQYKVSGVALSTQFSVLPKWQLNIGFAYDTRTINWQNQPFETTKENLSIVDNSFWNYTYQTILTPGYKYNQGVAFHDTTESLLTDSTLVQQMDTTYSTIIDTVQQSKQSFSASYVSIPVVFNYVVPMGRFNLLVGLGVRNSFMVKQDFKANPEYDFALVKAPKYSMNILANLGGEAILTDRLRLTAGLRFEQILFNGVQFEHGMQLKPAHVQGYIGTVFRF